MIRKVFFIAFVLSLFLMSCQNNREVSRAGDLSIDLKEVGNRLSSGQENKSEIDSCDIVKRYNLPLPMQLLQNSGLANPDMSLLLDVDSASSYIDIVSKSFAYGVYLADLAYSLSFEKEQQFIKDFDACITLSKELNINTSITYDYLKRLADNFDKDSAANIVRRAVRETCNYLEQTGQMNVLPNVIAGSWVESMYLLTGTILVNQDVDLKVYQLVSDQYAVADSIKSLIEDSMIGVESFKVNESYQNFIEMLGELKEVYNEVYITDQVILDNEDMRKIFDIYASIRKRFL